MAKITAADVGISIAGDEVRLVVKGRAGSLRLAAADALLVSNGLGNAAVDLIGDDIARLPRIEAVHLRPFAEGGRALLRLTVSGLGPLTVVVDQYWLGALAEAAKAAIELSEAGGNA
ncbi:MAG: hypothetical protein V4502_13170 [Pseudomonadota bacterium]